jgi:copper chaperone CopZ
MSTTTTYKISNMKCGGCVAAAQAAVEPLSGVEAVDVDLDSASGVVTGDVDPQQVIDALTAAGYPAALADG